MIRVVGAGARIGTRFVEYSLQQFVGRRVVIDTSGPMLYIGTLREIGAAGYWLSDADVHDRNEGHSTKESYINEAHELERGGAKRVNRKLVFVERAAVMSISALEDVVTEDVMSESDEPDELPGDWMS